MVDVRCALSVAKWLGTTCVSVIALFHANAALAACLNTSGAVVCDTSRSNPSDPIAGFDIVLLPGAQVKQLDDPYAGASVPRTFDTVTLYTGGRLVTRDTSLITNFFPGASSVNVGAGGSAQIDGGVPHGGTIGIGLRLGANASLIVGTTGAAHS
ncbi:hypothetical protein HNO88_003698 [Novosphingobium chloroacetimidivorans]|uniref:Uncharacterized protein n=1 Tax=Novosphingobium chloroacetimidivorans TaxID=1428314 RepID=A0A7W7KD94_9SPHN|nr:hypothetical protein [Novosphingobium chloroacetimidivorans]